MRPTAENLETLRAAIDASGDEHLKRHMGGEDGHGSVLEKLVIRHIPEGDFKLRSLDFGASGAAVLLLIPEVQLPRVIKIGTEGQIAEEYKTFQTYFRNRVPPYVVGAILGRPHKSAGLASIASEWAAGTNTAMSLGDAFTHDRIPDAQLSKTLIDLLRSLFKWQTTEMLASKTARSRIPSDGPIWEWGAGQLTTILKLIRASDHPPDDVSQLAALVESPTSELKKLLPNTIKIGRCHGDVNGRNIVISSSETQVLLARLIDFGGDVRYRSRAFDWAKVEREIRFRCLAAMLPPNQISTALTDLDICVFEDSSLSHTLAPSVRRAAELIHAIQGVYERDTGEAHGKADYLLNLLFWTIADLLPKSVPSVVPNDAVITSAIRIMKAFKRAVLAASVPNHIRIPRLPNRRKPKSLTPIGAVPPNNSSGFTRLPPAPSRLFGRQKYLSELQAVRLNPSIRIVVVVGAPGEGKSALIGHWLQDLVDRDRSVLSRSLGWSFDTQANVLDEDSSVASFLSVARSCFDIEPYPDLEPWLAGERLADLLAQASGVMVLDAFEKVLGTPASDGASIKDRAIQALVRKMGSHTSGLLIITSRAPIKELKGKHVHQIEMDPIPGREAVAYVRTLGVNGRRGDIERAIKKYRSNALELTLFGGLVGSVFGGNLEKVRDIDSMKLPDMDQVEALLHCYIEWYRGRAEIEVLYCLSLFEVPATLTLLDRFRWDSPIEGLTERISQLSENEMAQTLSRLQALRIVLPTEEGTVLSCHDLIKHHLRESLRVNRAAWVQGNRRLFEYHNQLPPSYPVTEATIAPLVAAMKHGCQCGEAEQSFSDVYIKKIYGGSITRPDFGCFKELMIGISSCYAVKWSQLLPTISDDNAGSILNITGYNLLQLGQMRDALAPFHAALKIFTRRGDFERASAAAGNLSEIYIHRGELDEGVLYGRQADEAAQNQAEEWDQIAQRTTHAEALHRFGEYEQALMLFEQAESMQEKYANAPLGSFWGHRFNDLLLTMGRAEQVIQRTEEVLAFAKADAQLEVSLARLAILRAKLDKGMFDEQTLESATDVVDSLLRLQSYIYLPSALLARARYYGSQGELNNARSDIFRATKVCRLREMRLMYWECLYEDARLDKIAGKGKSVKAKLVRLIPRLGQYRRLREACNSLQ